MQNSAPLQTPTSKEEYYYRSYFHEHSSDAAAAMCASRSKCSTVKKSHWNGMKFQNMNDPSGRAVANVQYDDVKVFLNYFLIME
jgi:asparagine synthase (glutamine-hydrolysing)